MRNPRKNYPPKLSRIDLVWGIGLLVAFVLVIVILVKG